MAELGCAAENAIFGGRLRPCSGPRFRKDGAYHGNFTNMSIDDWPNPWEVSIYTKSEFSQKRTLVDGMYPLTDGAKCFSWHVPAAWTSWLFTRDFWETAVPKYGSRALQVPKFMCGYTTLWRGFPRTTRLMALEPITEVKEIIPIMEKVRERFLQREQDYENIRPWQLVEYRRWEGSPVSIFRIYYLSSMNTLGLCPIYPMTFNLGHNWFCSSGLARQSQRSAYADPVSYSGAGLLRET